MSSHHDHDDHHSNEPKTVAFRTPLILGLVTILAIMLLVSTCDKKHGCCEDGEKCEDNRLNHAAHSDHDTAATEHSNVEGHEHDVVTEETAAVADSIMKVDTVAAHPAEAAHH